MIELPEANNTPSLLPDMTALLDVIFILLVFMMLTANVAPHLLALDLPQAAAPASTIEPSAITLGISEQGVFSIEQQGYENWQAFQQALQVRIQQNTTTPQLLVAADKDAALGAFVTLAGWLAEQGHQVAEVVVNEQ